MDARRHKLQAAVDGCGLSVVWLFGAAVFAVSVDGFPQYAADEYGVRNLGLGTLYAGAVPLELLALAMLIRRWIKARGGWTASRRGLLVIPAAVIVNLMLQILALHLGLASIL